MARHSSSARFRSFGRAALATAGITAGLLVVLTGCGGTPAADSPPHSAGPSQNSSAPTVPSESTTASGWNTAPSSPESSGSAPASSGSTAGSPGSTTAGAGGAPKVIRYDNQSRDEVQLKKPSDVSELTDAPQSLKDYFAGLLAKKSTCQYGLTIGVQRVRTDGYAVGGVTECGGYAAIWAIVDGHWKEVMGSQDVWNCNELKKYQVPDSIAGTKCWDDKSNNVTRYSQS